MNTTHIRTKSLTAAVGAAIAGVASSALLFLGAGTAHAIQDVNEAFVPPLVQDVSEGAPGITFGAFNPQPDPPGIIDPGSKVGILDPGSRVGIVDPGLKTGLGGPDTRPAP
jgi:hypothetical protein